MKGIQESREVDLRVIATGMHLSPDFGLTYRDIERDGFRIDEKIEMLLDGDSSNAITKSTGLGVTRFADAFSELAPEVVVLLGDRFETFAAASSALFAGIPIAHIHGGETTEGAFDEAIRHSITKMSWWHFVATEEYRRRVIQLGESPDRVFNVGGLGVDAIKKTELFSKERLEKELGVRFGERTLLITFHPVSLEPDLGISQLENLLSVLSGMKGIQFIFTMPNADPGNRTMSSMIEGFVEARKDRAFVFTSMGQLRYLSTMRFVDGVVGNSSSGILEAPTFNLGTVNIGDRQKGRVQASSVIDCESDCESIRDAIDKLMSKSFRESLPEAVNPYEGNDTSGAILETLEHTIIPVDQKKKFFDLYNKAWP
jgi:GDP/UDP-N,N'-diacetylbacillosamine 2-epimerase (hydrolysing)